MARGTVKWFNTEKKYGFIRPDDNGPDVFVHQAVLFKCGISVLTDGTVVVYEAEKSEKGLKAKTIAIA